MVRTLMSEKPIQRTKKITTEEIALKGNGRTMFGIGMHTTNERTRGGTHPKAERTGKRTNVALGQACFQAPVLQA